MLTFDPQIRLTLRSQLGSQQLNQQDNPLVSHQVNRLANQLTIPLHVLLVNQVVNQPAPQVPNQQVAQVHYPLASQLRCPLIQLQVQLLLVLFAQVANIFQNARSLAPPVSPAIIVLGDAPFPNPVRRVLILPLMGSPLSPSASAAPWVM
jgi:hypothetical protein